jgi:hypothetical protein
MGWVAKSKWPILVPSYHLEKSAPSFTDTSVYNTRQAVALIRIAVEVKTRTRLVGVFPNETSAQTLATKIVLSSSEEEWALKCYLMMDVLKTVEEPKPQLSRP